MVLVGRTEQLDVWKVYRLGEEICQQQIIGGIIGNYNKNDGGSIERDVHTTKNMGLGVTCTLDLHCCRPVLLKVVG